MCEVIRGSGIPVELGWKVSIVSHSATVVSVGVYS